MPTKTLSRQPQSKRSAAAGADGICSVTFGPFTVLGRSGVGRIERVSVTSDSVNPTKARVYTGQQAEATAQSDVSLNGNDDAAEYVNPLAIPGYDYLIVRWENCTPGAIGTARIQYHVEF